MIKLVLLISAVAGATWFNWDKVPEPVRNALTGAKNVSEKVMKEGDKMPPEVDNFVDSVFNKWSK